MPLPTLSIERCEQRNARYAFDDISTPIHKKTIKGKKLT